MNDASKFARVLEQAIAEGANCAPEAPSVRDPVQELERVLAVATPSWSADGPRPPWAEELGIELPCDRQDIVRAFRRLAFRAHPDRAGGSHEGFLRAQALLEEALAWLRAAVPPQSVAARFHRMSAPVPARSVYA